MSEEIKYNGPVSGHVPCKKCGEVHWMWGDCSASHQRAAELERENADLCVALKDMLSGWVYIRTVYGDLSGVGWDRAQKKAEDALSNTNDTPPETKP